VKQGLLQHQLLRARQLTQEPASTTGSTALPLEAAHLLVHWAGEGSRELEILGQLVALMNTCKCQSPGDSKKPQLMTTS
jgi:hypothetical protein